MKATLRCVITHLNCSLEPHYHDGQTVFLSKRSSLNDGDVGLFTYDSLGFFKVYGEIEPEDDEKDMYTDTYGMAQGSLYFISFNKNYALKQINPDMFFSNCCHKSTQKP